MSQPLKISILVATYNRADLLAPLFASCDAAAAKAPGVDYEIVVVDDGSQDETWKTLEEEAKKRPGLIIHRQDNAGRASALNQTILLATGNMGFILDSDDLLTVDSLKLVAQEWAPLCDDPSYAGVIGHCLHLDGPKKGSIIGHAFPDGLKDSDPEELRVRYKIKGDKREVIRMELLKADLFPLTKGEKRVPTSLLLNRIGGKLKFRLIHEALILKTYLQGGMSNTIDRQRAKSANGSRLVYAEALQRARFKDSRYTFRNAANLVRYNLHAKMPAYKDFRLSPPFFASLAGAIAGPWFYFKDKKCMP